MVKQILTIQEIKNTSLSPAYSLQFLLNCAKYRAKFLRLLYYRDAYSFRHGFDPQTMTPPNSLMDR